MTRNEALQAKRDRSSSSSPPSEVPPSKKKVKRNLTDEGKQRHVEAGEKMKKEGIGLFGMSPEEREEASAKALAAKDEKHAVSTEAANAAANAAIGGKKKSWEP